MPFVLFEGDLYMSRSLPVVKIQLNIAFVDPESLHDLPRRIKAYLKWDIILIRNSDMQFVVALIQLLLHTTSASDCTLDKELACKAFAEFSKASPGKNGEAPAVLHSRL